MKVLLVAAEVAPIIKMGGLGDVIGALPKALEKIEVEADVIVPFFPFTKLAEKDLYKAEEIIVPYKGESNIVSVFNTVLPGSKSKVILLQNDSYFHGHNKTWKMSNEEEVELFSFFDRAVVEFIKSNYNLYDLVHCHDWHTGLVTHLLTDELALERPATLFTIHNLLYQGVSDASIVRNVGIVPGQHMLIDWDIADGNLNMIQQGITSADFVSTVSPTYMHEIQTPDYGGGFDDILKAREAHLAGILNGIDYSALPREYDTTSWKEKRKSIKENLQKELNLEIDWHKPLFAFVGRLDPHQKGIDILYDSLQHLLENGGQFVLLGSGDTSWEEKFKSLAKTYQDKRNLSINILFDPVLSQKIYSASDFLIVPSRYEPCGLIQMIAMWYGSVPIVRATGGLKDSVKNGHTGFIFDEYSSQSLINALDTALNSYNGHDIDSMVTNAMTADFSWERSAEEYKKLYTKVVQFRKEAI